MKKVLIITYYWPPAGGPGVQRVVKFSKYLPKFGWNPIILTVKNPTSPARDESLLEHLPKNCKVYKTKTIEPFNFYRKLTGRQKNEVLAKDIISKKSDEKPSEKLARVIRANLFIPDARVGWIPYIIKEGMKIIDIENPSLIFSTSPPHSVQLGAKKLAKRSGLKWIADFRDPWTEAYWEEDIDKTGLIKKVNLKLEKNVLASADLITTVSKGMIDVFSTKISNRYDFLYNGLETFNTKKSITDKFEIIFLGNLSKYQSPLPFIEAINLLPHKTKLQMEITFIGKVFDDYLQLFNKYDGIQINVKEYMPYQDMMHYVKKASMLLLIYHKTSYTTGYMTAKIFDYLALRKPILALGQLRSTGEDVLQQTGSGQLFEYSDIENISKYIAEEFEQWTKKHYVLLQSNKALDNYKTIENVKKLVKLFEEVLN